MLGFPGLNLLHSERTKLYTILDFLSVIWLNVLNKKRNVTSALHLNNFQKVFIKISKSKQGYNSGKKADFSYMYMLWIRLSSFVIDTILLCFRAPERGIEDNSRLIFLISQWKYICCDPSLELS